MSSIAPSPQQSKQEPTGSGSAAWEAGASTRARARKKRRQARFLLLGILGVLIAATGMAYSSMVAGASGTALAIFGLLLYIVLDPIQRKAAAYLDEAKRADKGALAEERAGAILQGANPREFWVLHDVVYPGGNIDHVVISKRGSVFAIETKSTKGIVDCCGEQLLVNGAPPQKDYLKQTLRGAMWLNDRIAEATGFKPFVEAVLLFPNASVNVRTTIREVTVSSEWYLSQLLRRHPSSTEQREHLWASRDLIQKQLTGSR